jgi:hypothetical protein
MSEIVQTDAPSVYQKGVKWMRIVIFTLVTALLLTGCAKTKNGDTEQKNGGRKAFLDIRAKYIAAESLSLSADMTADYGDRVYEYKLTYTGNGESGEINVTEPSIINGLTALYQKGEVTLRYDGAVIDTGAILGDDVSPLQAFPMLIEAWKTGYVSNCWKESRDGVKCTAAEIVMCESEENSVLCHTWFDSVEYKPVYSEISVNGVAVLFCKFEI